MGIANTGIVITDPRLCAARAVNAPGSLCQRKGRGYVRPYTEFDRGGLNRFRPVDSGPKLFSVA